MSMTLAFAPDELLTITRTVFPVAYSVGADFRRASRIPARHVVHGDRWRLFIKLQR